MECFLLLPMIPTRINQLYLYISEQMNQFNEIDYILQINKQQNNLNGCYFHKQIEILIVECLLTHVSAFYFCVLQFHYHSLGYNCSNKYIYPEKLQLFRVFILSLTQRYNFFIIIIKYVSYFLVQPFYHGGPLTIILTKYILI